MIVAGTRPEVIKLAPVIWSLEKLGVNYVFVWSGQHYDYELSWVFFEQLGLPKPHVNLNVGSSSHSEQTAKVMVGVEGVIRDLKPSVVVALGDTNTTLGAALASAKTLTPFAHVEAGLRSWDRTMPEEVNRIVADIIAEINFAPTWLAAVNLMHTGIPLRKIHITGNTIVDVVYKYRDLIAEEGEKLLQEFKLKQREFVLATIHRQENTDNQWRLENIAKALVKLSKHVPVIFPAHPRTIKRLEASGLLELLKTHVKLLKPLGYFEFLGLLSKSALVLTDSGGVQEEACILGIPTLTLRYNTERPETVLAGTNVVVGVETERVVRKSFEVLESREYDSGHKNCNGLLGDGRAGERIAGILRDTIETIKIEDFDSRRDPYIIHILADNSKIRNWKKLLINGDILAMYDINGIPTMDANDADKLIVRTSKSLLSSLTKEGREED
jgi:UDP-N-acetylglucosamine 2-epimerase (non-hydrolysing)